MVGTRIIASSNIGDPTSNATTNTSVVEALNSANGTRGVGTALCGQRLRPISAVIGVAFVGTDKGTMTALDVFNGKTLWSYGAPGKVGGGASYRSWPSAVGLRLHAVQRIRPGRRHQLRSQRGWTC